MKSRYVIMNEHGELYTGNQYVYQGDRYAVFGSFNKAKFYKSEKTATNAMKRLPINYNHYHVKEVKDSEL